MSAKKIQISKPFTAWFYWNYKHHWSTSNLIKTLLSLAFSWRIRILINPFVICNTTNLTTTEDEQLIDLRNDKFYVTTFSEKNLDEFWLSVENLYPAISLKAVKILLPFASSWLCEFGFSSLTEIRFKKRERLFKINDEMRACLATLEPRFNLICSRKQAQPSH